MNEPDLIEALHYLGIDENNCRVMALLPLVQVAWADGRIQDGERQTILKIAHDEQLVPGEGERVLDGWLTHSPTEQYFQRGHEVIVELARRGRGSAPG